MNRHFILLAGVLIFLAMGWLTIYPAAQRIEATLRDAASEAVEAEGYGWASVNIAGQTAILTGTAPSVDSQAAARDVILSAVWRGGPILGGITGVEDRSVVAAPMSPFIWRATSNDGKVRLEGSVPTKDAQVALLEAATTLFPAGAEDRTHLASGGPEGDWQAAAVEALTQLSRLLDGEAELSDAVVHLSGIVAEGTDRAGVIGALANLPDGYSGKAELGQSATPQPDDSEQQSEETVAMTPSATLPQPRARRLNPQNCQNAIDKVIAGAPVRFDFGRNEIQSASFGLLNEVAEVFIRCQDVKLRIGGHSDSQGSDAYNKLLSTKRAESVRDYLQNKGVSSRRMVAIGYGSARPIASNASLPGRARNRRISFEVFQ